VFEPRLHPSFPEYLPPRQPRVKVLTIGTFFLSVFLAINGGLSELIAQQPKDADGKFINPNNKLGQGALAGRSWLPENDDGRKYHMLMLPSPSRCLANYLFSVVYSFTYTPLQGVYPAENLTSSTRAKGLAASGIIVSLFGFINTYAGPIALERMKNRYIFVFVVWDLIETAIWWFCGVETVGRTIEEWVLLVQCLESRMTRIAKPYYFLPAQVGRDLQPEVPAIRLAKEGHCRQDQRGHDRSGRRVIQLHSSHAAGDAQVRAFAPCASCIKRNRVFVRFVTLIL
jgi:hypothetical protein